MPYMMYDHLVHTLLPHMKINFNEKAILVAPLSPKHRELSNTASHFQSFFHTWILSRRRTMGRNNLFACENSIFTSLSECTASRTISLIELLPMFLQSKSDASPSTKDAKKRIPFEITTKKNTKTRLPRVYGVLRLSSSLVVISFSAEQTMGLVRVCLCSEAIMHPEPFH